MNLSDSKGKIIDTDVIISHLCDTRYQADVILHFVRSLTIFSTTELSKQTFDPFYMIPKQAITKKSTILKTDF